MTSLSLRHRLGAVPTRGAMARDAAEMTLEEFKQELRRLRDKVWYFRPSRHSRDPEGSRAAYHREYRRKRSVPDIRYGKHYPGGSDGK